MHVQPHNPTACDHPIVRVSLVEPSAYMARRVAEALGKTGDIKIAAVAKDGLEAIKLAGNKSADVLVIDISLPRVDGLVVIEHIMRSHPLPIIAVGENAHPGHPSGRAALAAGAVGLLSREGNVILDTADYASRLVASVRQAARIKVVRTAGTVSTPDLAHPAPAWRPAAESLTRPGESFPLVVIASSTGGPAALTQLARRWSARPLPAMLIAQHLPAGFTAELARQLQACCPLSEIREARSGDIIRPGLILVAPGGRDLVVNGGQVDVLAPDADRWTPSANRLFQSAARYFSSRVRAFVLTGMGDDGAGGVRAVHQNGGLAWAQNADSCIVDGMPAAARQTGCVKDIDLPSMAALIAELAPMRATSAPTQRTW